MSFILFKNTPIICNNTTTPVENAINILQRDLESLLTESTSCASQPGHIEINLEIQQDLSDESYKIKVTQEKIRIEAKSCLGAVYAILHISRDYLGVQPFWFWLDKIPEQRSSVSVETDEYLSCPDKIQFRGWFINDEVLLDGWEPLNKPNDFIWRMVMETLLRLGGNMIIPGTDENGFKYRRLAADMGLWITHHHAEPLGAEMFGRVFPDLEASYSLYGQKFREIWKKSITGQSDYNVIWALGFRGQGDRPFWEDDSRYDTAQKRGALISEIIHEQYNMVRESKPDAVCCVNLYGETLELHRDGYLNLPEDVIYIWADSGYGKMVSRRQGNHNPRIPASPDHNGKHGIYYHASFFDLQASNHITMLPNSPEMVYSELSGAISAGADDYLLVNCGSVRPHCYILDLTAELWKNPDTSVVNHMQKFADAYFNGNRQIADLLFDFSNHTIQYGSYSDEKAGEQIYHYPVRQIAAAWMRGDIVEPLNSLIWLCDDKPFEQQVKQYYELTRKAQKSWKPYVDRCAGVSENLSEELKQRFYDNIQLQAEIHYTGACGAMLFCESFIAAEQEDYLKAFILAWKAKETYAQAIDGFERAEHGIWSGYYDNDCLTDIRLTVEVLEKLQGWLRIKGEGADAGLWYRSFLMDEKDRGICLLMYKHRPLPDDVLAYKLSEGSSFTSQSL